MRKQKLQPHQLLQTIQFSERLVETGLWIQIARDLEAAAAVLEPEIQQYWAEVKVENRRVVDAPLRSCVQAQYLMLMAYALENYFKAILIHRNIDSLRGWLLSDLPCYIKSHNLVGLAREANIQLNTSEEELLCRLTRYSMWAARYPVPTDSDSLKAEKELSDGRRYLMACYYPTDLDRILCFAGRLRETVLKETESTATTHEGNAVPREP
jgi:hypothetical protein